MEGTLSERPALGGDPSTEHAPRCGSADRLVPGPAEHVEAAPTSCETADAVRHPVGVSELHCRTVPEARDLAVQRFVRTSFASGSATVLAAAATSPPTAPHSPPMP